MRRFLDVPLATLMLLKLANHTLRAVDWERMCYRELLAGIQDFSHMKFTNMVPLLIKQGLIKRIRRGVYRITEKGKAQLELWQMEKKNNETNRQIEFDSAGD